MMDESIKSRVDALMARKIQGEELAASKARAEAEAAEQREAKKVAARTRWTISRAELESAVSNLNKSIKDAGLELYFEPEKPAADTAIAQVIVALKDRGIPTKQRLVFNVSAFGQIQLVGLIPHTGPQMVQFSIAESSVDRFQSTLVEFLEHCIAK